MNTDMFIGWLVTYAHTRRKFVKVVSFLISQFLLGMINMHKTYTRRVSKVAQRLGYNMSGCTLEANG